MLEILEDFVQDKGYNYLKMDGSTSIPSRQPLIQKFNKVDNKANLYTCQNTNIQMIQTCLGTKFKYA